MGCRGGNSYDKHPNILVSSLKILFLNVNGLYTKTRIPEFLDMIANYDIVAFGESKTDDFDNFNLPGFTTSYMKNRKESRHVKSGRIFVAIKDNISEYFCLVEGNCSELVLWLQEKVSDTNKRVALGFVYVPPSNSFYYDDESFEKLESDINILKNKGFEILLMGDFNARTTENRDFDEFDDKLLDYVGMQSELLPNETIADLNKLADAAIPLARKSQDTGKILMVNIYHS